LLKQVRFRFQIAAIRNDGDTKTTGSKIETNFELFYGRGWSIA